MKEIQSLSGTWLAQTVTPDGRELCLPATVPGMIHVDLEREGIIPPMFERDNAEQCQWVEHCHWTYSRRFFIEKERDLRHAVLALDGVDTYAEVTLNGKTVGTCGDMFIPYRFDVSNLLRLGENEIRVAFVPYQEKIIGKPLHYPAAFNKAERVHVRRMQCTFYWDWVNRFVTFGLWRDVSLLFYGDSYIESLFAYTNDIAATSASINLHLNTEYFDEDYVACAELSILDPDGKPVYEQPRFHIIDRHMRLQADLENPLLWWPIGYGSQPLYTLSVKLFSPSGELLDEKSERFGIRTVRIEQLRDRIESEEHQKTLALREENDRAGAEPGVSFTLLVNGTRVFCKGGNWVPADPFPSRVTQEKYRRLVRYAAQGGLNLLRVWGGGIYESPDFYDACDEMGVMISQDFMLACAHFPEEDEDFLKHLRVEIPLAVKALRNHPSLVWWAGDNENACHYDWDARKAPGVKLCREIFYPTLDRLDPSRPFRPTSPSGGLNNCSPTVGDCHMSHWGCGEAYREKLKTLGRFASESVFFGSPLLTSLRKFMTDADIADPEKAMYEYHVKDNPHKPEGAPTLYEGMRLQSEAILGVPKSPEDRVRRDAYLQYEWARVSMEGARCNKWYTSGLQYWMYNDCWPAVGLSTIDAYLIPKAAYYALKRTCAPLIASIRETAQGYEILTLNDSRESVSGTLRLFVQPTQAAAREIAHIPFTSRANENDIVLRLLEKEVNLGANEALIAELFLDGKRTDRAFYWRDLPKELSFPEPKYTVQYDNASSTITISAQTYLRAVMLDGDAVPEDNFFDLLPGEEKVISVECLNHSRLTDLTITCLN